MNRKNLVLAITVVASIAIFGMNSCDKKKVKLSSKKDSISWVLGENIARGFKATEIDIDKKVLLKSIENCLDGKESALDDSSFTAILEEIRIMMMINERTKMQEASETAKKQEEVFFKQLKEKDPDVKVTTSGLHYKVLSNGSGRKPFNGCRVRFHYKASFADGTVFDQTYNVRKPILTVINNIFPGLSEGMKLMNEKSHFIFYIPNHLAFGGQGTEGVPPYSMVIYEIELFEVLD
jgi:FKBP-type peptidyl-prolyl cis-trans isomerase